MRRSTRYAMHALIVAGLWFAQGAGALSLLDIMEMSRNGYSEAEIGRLLEATGARFEIDAVGLVALQEAAVADALIDRMLDEGGVPPNEVSGMTGKELLELHEAGLSETTLLKFVRHRNVCQPLSEDGVHLLEREAFSATFFEEFADLVAACEQARVAREPIEPLPETAYAGSSEEAHDLAGPRVRDVYQETHYYDTYHYDRRYYDRYHSPFGYSYYPYDPLRRVYPVYIYRDHRDRDRRDRKHRRRSPRHDGTPPRERGDLATPDTASRLFDRPRPFMGARPGAGGGGARGSTARGNGPGLETPVPGGPLLERVPGAPASAGPRDTQTPQVNRSTTALPEVETPPAMPRTPLLRGLPASVRVPRVMPTPVVPGVPAPQVTRPAHAVPSANGAAPRSAPVRRRNVSPPNRATPRVTRPRTITRPVPAPRVAPSPTPARPVAPRSVTPRAPARRAEPARRPVAPRAVMPRNVRPPVAAPTVRRPTSVPRPAAPRRAAPRAVVPRSSAPRTVTPRAVAPRAVVPRSSAPRAVTPRAVAPRAAPRPAQPRVTAPRRVTPAPRRGAARQAPREGDARRRATWRRRRGVRRSGRSSVDTGRGADAVVGLPARYTRASYNGYYPSFPSWRRGFDSHRPLHLRSDPGQPAVLR